MPRNPVDDLPGSAKTGRPSYRVVLVDSAGAIKGVTPLPVHDDACARAVARRMANGVSAELWDDLRYIDRFDAKG